MSRNRVARFDHCGAAAHVWFSEKTGELRIAAHYCRDRFCVACGTARGALIAANLRDYCEGLTMRFVTLTLRGFAQPLQTSLKRLYDSFSRLRESFLWKTHVKGGAAFVEVKRGSGSGHWHVHLHILCHGRYLDKRELSNAWLAASGDSFIVDIRAVHDTREVAGYVTKYVAKPLDNSVFHRDGDLAECIDALHGRRMCNTFGDWRGLELERRRNDPGDWREVGPLDALILEADCGDATCRGILESITSVGWSEEDPPGARDRPG